MLCATRPSTGQGGSPVPRADAELALVALRAVDHYLIVAGSCAVSGSPVPTTDSGVKAEQRSAEGRSASAETPLVPTSHFAPDAITSSTADRLLRLAELPLRALGAVRHSFAKVGVVDGLHLPALRGASALSTGEVERSRLGFGHRSRISAWRSDC